MTNAISKTHPMYAKIAAAVNAGKIEFLAKELVRAGASAKVQLTLALTMQQIADEREVPNTIPSLADTIIVEQSHKVAKYGDKAFPLSENQCGVIVRDCVVADWQRHMANVEMK